jgi:hypothetical protein
MRHYTETWEHAHDDQGVHYHSIGAAAHNPHPVDDPQHHIQHGARVIWDSKRGSHTEERA